MTDHYNVIVAGGGLGGVLVAAKLAHQNPEHRVLLVERQSKLGGRLRNSDIAAESWGVGLNTIGEELFNYWDQSLKSDPDGADLAGFAGYRQRSVGAYSASQVKQIPVELWFSPKGANLLAGRAGQRDWKKIEELEAAVSEGESKAKSSFNQVYSGNRKSASAIVLEHFARCFGIPDIWQTTPQVIVERAKYYVSKLHKGDWDKALNALIESCSELQNLSVLTECLVLDARKEGETWLVETPAGEVSANALVVAQTPWEALQWLPKEYWPSGLLNLTLKTKPVSVVVLSEQIIGEIDLPDVLLIPAENVQAIVSDKEIAFQATLDFELSLQAPAVVKAVRRLKRARKKLLKEFPGTISESNHIALVPVGWAQPIAPSERRLAEKLDKEDLQTSNLCFCGDAYGSSINGDANLLQSVRGTLEALSSLKVQSVPNEVATEAEG